MSLESKPTPENGQSYRRQLYAAVLPWITPPIGAGVAIIPAFPGLMWKSFFQTTQTPVVALVVKAVLEAMQNVPKLGIKNAKKLLNINLSMLAKETGMPMMSLKEALKAGVQAAPLVSGIVGGQMILRKGVEKGLEYYFPDRFTQDSLTKKILSSIPVSIISIIPLAALNGKTLKKTAWESVKGLSKIQGVSIFFREESFILCLSVNDFVKKELKRIFGDNVYVGYLGAAATGIVGSLCGQPFDAALSLSQKGIPITSASQLMKGTTTRALSLAVFSVGYEAVSDCIKSTVE